MDSGCSERPLVTVYVLNRNYGRFLGQAIDSVLRQEYPFIEVLVVDDASDDGSTDVLARFEGQHRVRILRQASNRGLTACANAAIRHARGEFLMRLDADDYLDPSAVGKMVAEIAKVPAAVLVFPDYFDVDLHGRLIRRVKRRDVNVLEAMSDLPAHGACTLVRRSFLEAIGGYDETVSCQDGLDLWLHLGPEDRVLHVAEPLFSYRQHGNNLTRDEGLLLAARAKLFAKHVQRRGVPRLSVIGIIPASRPSADPGSIPLLRPMGGRPLIEWTLEGALDCDAIDHVVVSSRDRDLLSHIASRYGSLVGLHRHTTESAGSAAELKALETDVLRSEALQGRRYQAEMTLGVECPFRSGIVMRQAVHIMQLFDAHGVVGVRRDDDVFYTHNGLGLEPLRPDEGLRLERDDLFRECGGMRLTRLSGRKPLKRMGHVLLDQRSAFTIRTELDWLSAELLSESKYSENRVG